MAPVFAHALEATSGTLSELRSGMKIFVIALSILATVAVVANALYLHATSSDEVKAKCRPEKRDAIAVLNCASKCNQAARLVRSCCAKYSRI